jgi:hypothetical protein
MTITLTPSKATYHVGETTHVTVSGPAASGPGSLFTVALYQGGSGLADVAEGDAALTFSTDFPCTAEFEGQTGLTMHATVVGEPESNTVQGDSATFAIVARAIPQGPPALAGRAPATTTLTGHTTDIISASGTVHFAPTPKVIPHRRSSGCRSACSGGYSSAEMCHSEGAAASDQWCGTANDRGRCDD